MGSHTIYVIKIKSHRRTEDAVSHADCLNIWGNTFADEAAVRTRKTDLPSFDQLCKDVRQHYVQQKRVIPQIWHYMLEIAYQWLLKAEEDAQYHKDLPMGLARATGSQAANPRDTPDDTPLTTCAFVNISNGMCLKITAPCIESSFGPAHGASLCLDSRLVWQF